MLKRLNKAQEQNKAATPPLPPEGNGAAAAPAAPAAAPAAPAATDGTAIDPALLAKMIEASLWIADRIQASVGQHGQMPEGGEADKMIQDRFAQLYRQTNMHLSESEVKRLYEMVYHELTGFGPIQALLNDDSISEVMVNGPRKIYVERKGKLTLSGVQFANDEHVQRVIDRIIRPLGRRVDRKWPMVDARLPDGSRVNAIIPPCAIDGSTITIRKFSKNRLQVADLIKFGSMTPQMAEFLEACVVSHLNIVVSGGTGSGKTTLLNVLSNFVPSGERIVTIEDSAELQLAQDHVVRLEAKPAEIDGSGKVAIRDLVINSLRMRPERIVVGECRSGEALDMLQAMNTGHDGSLTTLHANTPRDALARLETMSMMAGMDMPLDVIRQQIASAIHLIVQQTRLDDGSRKVSHVTEVQGMEGNTIVLQDIFLLDIKGKGPDGKYITEMKPTGVRPSFTRKLEAAGFKLPPSVFGMTPGKR